MPNVSLQPLLASLAPSEAAVVKGDSPVPEVLLHEKANASHIVHAIRSAGLVLQVAANTIGCLLLLAGAWFSVSLLEVLLPT